MIITFIIVSFIFWASHAEMDVKNADAAIRAVLDSLPKECHKNGKTFKAGEQFEFGNLRYKCQQYGVYSIEGCQTSDKKHLAIGEKLITNNTLHQCLGSGGSVFYRETTCGILGQPECDKIPPPKGFTEAEKKTQTTVGETSIGGVKLPDGWTVVNKGSKRIDGTNATLLTQVLMFKPRTRRQSGHGIGQVVAIEKVEGEKGHPLDPKMETPFQGGSNQFTHNLRPTNEPFLAGTQTVTATVGSDEDSLEALNEQVQGEGLQIGSVSGSKSSVEWDGGEITVNGKSIAAGPGTFTFGNQPTTTRKFL